MGWYGTYNQTIAESIAEQTEPQKSTDEDGTIRERVTLAKSYRGGTNGVLYAVIQNIVTRTDGTTTITRHIYVSLMRGDRYGRETTYKPMDCCSGPAVTSCPLKYVEMIELYGTADHGKYCAEWRAQVRAAAVAKQTGRKVAKALKSGDYITVKGFDRPFRVENPHRTRGTIYVSGNGYAYAHVSKSRIVAIVPAPSAVGSYTT